MDNRENNKNKVLIATFVAFLFIFMALTTTPSFAQTQQQAVQEESDGDLTATLNGELFQAGDTIAVRGTVGERDIDSFVVVEIIDPEGETVESAYPDVTADNTWQQSFTPGGETNIYSKEWTESGNYRMTVSYSVPGEGFEREELEFVFSYDAASTTTDGSDIDSTGGSLYTSADGFRLQVPRGWIIDDVNNTSLNARVEAEFSSYADLAELCPQTGAVPQIGGTYTCSASEDAPRVSIARLSNLTTRSEFAPIVSQGQNITISDLTALWIQTNTEDPSTANYEVLESEERTVNIFDSATNRTFEEITAPAQWVRIQIGEETEGLFRTVRITYSALLVLSPDGNTGYVLTPTGRYSPDEGLPSDVQQILDSFELAVPSSISTTTPPTVSPPQQEQQQPSSSTPELVL